ncbi:MAG: N-acetylmuramic acid 6-phosphate etherase, partial [Devosia sp.]
SGGRLIYLGAGTPALISLGDALEVPQTYGIPRDRVLVILAGGKGIVENLNGPEEDDGPLARIKVAEAGVGPGDCVIATSASGSTPYTVSGLTAAREAGAATIGVAGNPGAPLFDVADVSVLIEAGPEVISGSTRLGAGTAQKAALNLFSTLLGVKLGHVHDGLMVNMVADNAKLRKRAARIVAQVTGVALPQAEAALSETDGAVKPAILIAAGAAGYDTAIASLQAAGGNVRAALIALAR